MQITRHESEHKRVSILPFHPLADMFPPMTEAEFSDLVADIDKHSLRQEIDTWQGMILEGRHRALACQQLGIEPKYHERWFSDDDGARAYVISQNIHRRHLTVEQKRDVIAALLKANPSKSDRTIAKQAMTHHHAVANVRLEEEGRGNISHVEKRTDSKGRKQPAKRQKAAKVADERKSEPPSEPGLDKKRGIIAGIERLASRLISADPESARELYKLLGDDTQVHQLRRALGYGLRIDEDASDGEAAPSASVVPDDGLGIPDYLRRAPKDVALS